MFELVALSESPKAICMAGFVGKKFGSAKITPNTNTE